MSKAHAYAKGKTCACVSELLTNLCMPDIGDLIGL